MTLKKLRFLTNLVKFDLNLTCHMHMPDIGPIYVTVHDEPGVKSHIANACYRSQSNHNPIHTYNNSKVQRINEYSASGYRMKLN